MGGLYKIFAPLLNPPLVFWTIGAFQDSPSIQQTILVLSERNLEQGQRLIKEQGWKKIEVCLGGARRQDSIAKGLQRLKGCYWVVIHDGARPCVSSELIEQGIKAAIETGAAIAAVPVKDTIKIVGAANMVRETPLRENLWIAQTPQVFRFDIITEAYRQVQDEATDDATLVERLGHKVVVYMGSYNNIKVATPEDLALAEVILRNKG